MLVFRALSLQRCCIIVKASCMHEFNYVIYVPNILNPYILYVFVDCYIYLFVIYVFLHIFIYCTLSYIFNTLYK